MIPDAWWIGARLWQLRRHRHFVCEPVRLELAKLIVPASSGSHTRKPISQKIKLTSVGQRDCRWPSSIQSSTSSRGVRVRQQISTAARPPLGRDTLEARTNHAKTRLALQLKCRVSFDNAQARSRLQILHRMQPNRQSEESGEVKESVETANSKLCREPGRYIRFCSDKFQ